jgi:hypothetical protein
MLEGANWKDPTLHGKSGRMAWVIRFQTSFAASATGDPLKTLPVLLEHISSLHHAALR